MARKKKHEEHENHENHERWLVSYADFITLLFAFFVVMYSVSVVNEGRFRVLSESLVAAFRNPAKSIDPVQFGNPMKAPPVPNQQQQNQPAPPRPGMAPPVSLPMMQRAPDPKQAMAEAQKRLEAEREKKLAQLAADIEAALAPLIDKDLVHVRKTRHWMEVEIKTSILFGSGSSQISVSSLPTLKKVAELLAAYPNPIHVEGFTDDRPIKTVAFPSNWELSAARAASVVHLFSRSGIDSARMAAIGYGEHHPVSDNATAEGRNANRRVVLVVLADPNAKRLRDQAREPLASDVPAATPVAVPAAGPSPPVPLAGDLPATANRP